VIAQSHVEEHLGLAVVLSTPSLLTEARPVFSMIKWNGSIAVQMAVQLIVFGVIGTSGVHAPIAVGMVLTYACAIRLSLKQMKASAKEKVRTLAIVTMDHVPSTANSLIGKRGEHAVRLVTWAQ